jgi:hypothetical protein
MVFLLQVFAPDERVDWARLRVIYVFCCKRGSCYVQNNNIFRVFRCQLPMENAYYETSTPNSFKKLITLPKLCDFCGFRGDEICAACQTFLSSHQEPKKSSAGRSGYGKPYEMTATMMASKSQSFTFPEYGIEMQAEEIPPDNDFDEKAMNDEIGYKEEEDDQRPMDYVEIKHVLNLKSQKLDSIHHDDTTDDHESQDDDEEMQEAALVSLSESLEDQTFSKFMKRSQLYPKQILRYARRIDSYAWK